MKKILYSKYSNERIPEFAIRTTILQDGEHKWVEKRPLSIKAKRHIENLETAHQRLSKIYGGTILQPCPVIVKDGVAIFDFVEGKSFQSKLGKLIQMNDKKGAIELSQQVAALLGLGAGIKKFKKTPEFIQLFGDVSLPEGLMARDYSNIDMLFENLVEDNTGKVILLDYEWCFPFPVPQEYILYRALRISFEKFSWGGFAEQVLCPVLGISDDLIPLFLQMDQYFCKMVGTAKTLTFLNAIGHFQNNIIDFSQALIASHQLQCHVQLFLDTGKGFNESQVQNISHIYDKDLELKIPIGEGVRAFRLDPAMEPVLVIIKKCCLVKEEGLCDFFPISNGFPVSNAIVFDTNDPQLQVLDLESNVREIRMTLYMMRITPEAAEEYARQQYKEKKYQQERLQTIAEEYERLKSKIAQELLDGQGRIQSLEQELEGEQRRIQSLEQELEGEQGRIQSLEQELLQAKESYAEISGAFFWKITKPARVISDIVKTLLKKNRYTYLFYKGLRCLKQNGFSFTWKKILQRRKECQRSRKLLKENNFDNKIVDIIPPIMYESDYQVNRTFAGCSTDVKVLAFYLPQFHTFVENDTWWGKGFTEWTNVKKGAPRFRDHYQPRTPHKDIGYYCLEDINVMRWQAELAKSHGIYGFCFYYYWFSGKRLMEKPVDLLLKHPEIDIPFCLCWANENWTRRWDGQEHDILIKQEYSDEDDEKFIIDLKKYLDDPRYIRVHGRPVIVVYSPCAIPDCRKSFQKWREVAKEIGVGEIEIWICLTWGQTSKSMRIIDCVNAEVEFPPHNLGGEWLEIPNIDREGEETIVYDYTRAVDFITDVWKRRTNSLIPIHYTCMLAWDNAARRKDGWHAFYHFSLKSFYRWLSDAVHWAKTRLPKDERFIFINAWNEWGEGTYLEPDKKYGYANINTAAKAIFGLPLELETKAIDESFPVIEENVFRIKEDTPRIAVQAHVFYTDLLREIIEELNKIPYQFDLFITTDTQEKKEAILPIVQRDCHCRQVNILVLLNRGRDVAPFLVQMAPEINQYDYIGHIHTKRTVTANYGDEWRNYLFHNLFGSTEYIKRIFYLFESDERLGIVFPEMFAPIREHAKWNGENKEIQMLLEQVGFIEELPEELVFPAGNMFWARTDAVRPLFTLHLNQTDFPEEAGQRYGTLAHQIERSWIYVAEKSGYGYCNVLNSCSGEGNIKS